MSAIVPLEEAGESGLTGGMKNAFQYEETKRMEQINETLRSKYMISQFQRDEEDSQPETE